MVGNLHDAVKYLKLSVLHLEDFNNRLSALTAATQDEDAGANSEVKIIDIETKLFIDEFFDTESKEIVKKDFS